MKSYHMDMYSYHNRRMRKKLENTEIYFTKFTNTLWMLQILQNLKLRMELEIAHDSECFITITWDKKIFHRFDWHYLNLCFKIYIGMRQSMTIYSFL